MRHIITLASQTRLTPGFWLAHNIDLNQRCTEHSGTFRGFLLTEARMVQCCIIPAAAQDGLRHQDVRTLGWVDIGTRTKVPLGFVTYISKITKINKKSVLTQ
jgi:hypothetical protein